MILFDIVVCVVWAVAGFWALYLLLFPAIALIKSTKCQEIDSVERPAIAVIVPAHNVEQILARCLASIRACHYPPHKVQIFVVADHCTDLTEEVAGHAGAVVLGRTKGNPGKTYALAWAFDQLVEKGIDSDLYIIVDATAYVDERFLAAMARGYSRGEDIIVGRATVDSCNQQWFARNVGLSLAHRSLQNWARERLRLSSLIQGCGMAYSRNYIKKFRWTLAVPASGDTGNHPTEDWRHGVRAVEHGVRVAFADNARVFTPLRDTLGDATRQGMRWEKGRIANALTYGMELLMHGIKARNKLKVCAALDAIQPPVAILGGTCIVVAMLAGMTADSAMSLLVGLGPLALVIAYGFAVVERASRDGIKRRALLWVPIYIVWRCTAFALALSGVERTGSTGRRKTKKDEVRSR